MLRTGAVVVLAAAVSGCSGSHPSARPAPSPTPSPTPAASALAGAAARTSAASYAASYAFHDAHANRTATVNVWRAGAQIRVDVVSGRTTATLLVTPKGTYSCSVKGVRRSCLTVAKPGQPVPRPFDVAPVALFTTYMDALAADAASYDVTRAQAPDGLPAGVSCFGVRPQSVSEPVPEATYCFTADGVLAAADYPSGNTVRLTDSLVQPPPASTFVPYASPRPLPS